MTKCTVAGAVVGVVFAAAISYGAAAMAFDAGGFVLLAAAVDGLFAALCIAGLIAANFALASTEKTETASCVTGSAESSVKMVVAVGVEPTTSRM